MSSGPGAAQACSTIAKALDLPTASVSRCISMLDDGCTVPFICRYRKEQVGCLEPSTVRKIEAQLEQWRSVSARRTTIVRALEKQGKLDARLHTALDRANTLIALEDLYAPYQSKRCTQADAARAMGLEPLADLIWEQAVSGSVFGAAAQQALSSSGGTTAKPAKNRAEALEGCAKILAEKFSASPAAREALRTLMRQRARITATLPSKRAAVAAAAPAAAGAASRKRKRSADSVETGSRKKQPVTAAAAAASASKYSDYAHFVCAVRSVQPHQWLALRRGAKCKELSVKVALAGEDSSAANAAVQALLECVPHAQEPRCPAAAGCLKSAARDAWTRLLRPCLGRETLKEGYRVGDEAALDVFADNLRATLLEPPMKNKRILGVDPGYKHGTKLAALSEDGSVLELLTIHYTNSSSSSAKASTLSTQEAAAIATLRQLLVRHSIGVVAVGNGTGTREAQAIVSHAIRDLPGAVPGLGFRVVSEACASVWSVSEEAAAEFPGVSCSALGAVSIGRRLLDPLSELVKCDPAALGLGMYQHDLSDRVLSDRLAAVVQDCVAAVGVDLNTASEQLLRHVSGLNKARARSIRAAVSAAAATGGLASRHSLLSITGIGPKTFEQAAGFLRVSESTEPLDNTLVHPEAYAVANCVLAAAGVSQSKLTKRLRSSDSSSSSTDTYTDDAAVTTVDSNAGSGSNGSTSDADSTAAAAAAAQEQRRLKRQRKWCKKLDSVDTQAVADQAGVTQAAVSQVVELLKVPVCDPRATASQPQLKQGVATMADVVVGEELEGTVQNVTTFGAFVDCSLDADGLLHRSSLPAGMTLATLHVGQSVKVKVASCDLQRRRLGLELLQ